MAVGTHTTNHREDKTMAEHRTTTDMAGDYMGRWLKATDAKREAESQVSELSHRVVTLEVALAFKERECERLKVRLGHRAAR